MIPILTSPIESATDPRDRSCSACELAAACKVLGAKPRRMLMHVIRECRLRACRVCHGQGLVRGRGQDQLAQAILGSRFGESHKDDEKRSVAVLRRGAVYQHILGRFEQGREDLAVVF